MRYKEALGEKAKKIEIAQELLDQIDAALANKEFQEAYKIAQKIIGRSDLYTLEVCKNLQLPLMIRSDPPGVAVTMNGKALGEVDYVLFPFRSSAKVKFDFSKRGYKNKTLDIFKRDINSHYLTVTLIRDVVWNYDTKGPIESPMKVVDDTLYIANRNADFFAIEFKNR